ncbi:MAG: hypothetical protein FJW61_05155 [Actinobacteria bacterium]|nr:hypothetical protein [Actinomycetota bacterium]MBM3709790.1 hypothetical protein [Actinomycetota bacterium]
MKKIIEILKGSTALYIGELRQQWDFDDIQNRFGLKILHIKSDEFFSAFDSLNDAVMTEELEKWRSSFIKIIEPSKQDLMNATRTYIVLRNLCKIYGATSIAFNCLTLHSGRYEAIPCLAFARLMDEGIICSCEGDISSLIALIMLTMASGKPSIMGNVRVLQANYPMQGFEIAIEHCILPLSISNCPGFVIRDHHGKGHGVTGYATIKTGQPATVVIIGSLLKKASIFEGVVSVSEEGENCRIGIRIASNNLTNELPALIYGHASLTLGNWSEVIISACEFFDLDYHII